jgi:hypothetical protein
VYVCAPVEQKPYIALGASTNLNSAATATGFKKLLPEMKFGHQLPRQAIPEWASSYINYKGLKQLIKTASQAVKNGADADLAGKWHLWFLQL